MLLDLFNRIKSLSDENILTQEADSTSPPKGSSFQEFSRLIKLIEFIH